MIRCVLFLYLIVLSSSLAAQPGFNLVYDSSSIGKNRSFFKIFVAEDTIYGIGVGYPSTPGPLGVEVAKMDSTGKLIEHTLLLDSLNDYLTMDYSWGNVIETYNGKIAFPVVGLGRGDLMLYQIDKSLKIKSIFNNLVVNDVTEFDEQLIELSDGAFLTAGQIQRPNLKIDGFIRKIDKFGNKLWSKYYGDYNKDEAFTGIVKVNENRFGVCGSMGPDFSNVGNARAGMWILDSNGVVLNYWTGSITPNLIINRGLLLASDGGFIAHGRTYWGEGPFGSKVQISIMKFDANLQLQWLKHIGPSSTNYNGIYDMIRTPDGNYLIAGERTPYGDPVEPSTDWGGWLYKFNEQGDSLWARADNAPPGYDPDGPFVYGGVGVLSSGSIVAGGQGYIGGKFVGWVVKVTADGCLDTLYCHTSGIQEVPKGQKMTLSPNPAGGSVQLSLAQSVPENLYLELYDLAGRLLKTECIAAGTMVHICSLEELSNGTYLVILKAKGRFIGGERLVVIH